MCCNHGMSVCWEGSSYWLFLFSSQLMTVGPVWDLLILGLSFWWVYVLDLVHPVDGLLALVYPSMSRYCQNNVLSPFCNNAMNWFLLYDCCFWIAGCAFLSVLILHAYSMLLNVPGLLQYNSCLFPGVCMFSGVIVVLWFSFPLFIMGGSGLSISWAYFWPFSEIGLHCVHNFLLGWLVQHHAAPFSVEQLVLCAPWLRFLCLAWSVMTLLNSETFLAAFLCLSYWLPRLFHCNCSKYYGIDPELLMNNFWLPSELVMLPGFNVMFWFFCPLCSMGTTGWNISCCDFCPFCVTKLQYVQSLVLGCMVQPNVALFLIEQLVLRSPWLRFSWLFRSMMTVLNTETFTVWDTITSPMVVCRYLDFSSQHGCTIIVVELPTARNSHDRRGMVYLQHFLYPRAPSEFVSML
uniref:Uncharacterized protein n=1 Tax=Opuntia streptacantha TaxID=393608 RepID=A0A7C9AWA4_OPUST